MPDRDPAGSDPWDTAGALARFHRDADAPEGPRLADYAETARGGDWTLRSALVRLAQPEPVRAGAVLELIRRTDGALARHRRWLDATTVATDRELVPGSIGTPRDPVRDARAVDLARVSRRFPDGAAIVRAYAELEGLGADELAVVPVLEAALELDALARVLTEWARTRPGPPPVDVVDEVASQVFRQLADVGVPRDSATLRRRRR